MIMQHPMIHLNGSGQANLMRDYCDCTEHLANALDALCRARPHGRDYYPLEPGAYESARDEHEARIDAVRGGLDEIWTLAEGVSDQGRFGRKS